MSNDLWLKLLLAVLLGLLLGAVLEPARGAELWVNLNARAYHFDRAPGYNERNLGLGLTYRADAHLRYLAGEYDNSFHHTSWYAGAAYFSSPLAVAGVAVRAGVAAGAVTGYDRRLQPVVLPTVSFECGRAEAALAYGAKASPKASALVALQLGWRW